MSAEYANTIEYLYSRLPMFTRIGAAAYKKDLDNTLALLEALGNPHRQFKSIHIAGTNGKGSTSHMLASIFHKAGYKTALYTSPHLYDFRERIKVSGNNRLEMVTEDFVVDFTERIKPLIEKIEPSFFEVTVAMAFEWFALQKADIAIIETGLGGRLDSTNVITPILSIITNIGWDHMNLLGDTLEKIAGEKAGIIKQGIPAVIGETLAETLPVFSAKAEKMNAPLILSEKSWDIVEVTPGLEHLAISLREAGTQETLALTCDLPGLYQQYNIRTLLTAWKKLRELGWNLDTDMLMGGLQNIKALTGLGGRWQVIGQNPWVVLDVAHNEAGMKALLEQINLLQKSAAIEKVHMVMGMVKDKDIEKVLGLLPSGFHYYFTQAQLPRALPYLELQEKALQYHLTGDAHATPDEALQTALLNTGKNDLVVVCGSVFVVSEISTNKKLNP